jgi:hypothetical protein
MQNVSLMKGVTTSLAAAAMLIGFGVSAGASAAVIPPAVLASPDIGDVAIAPPPPGAGTAYITCSQVCLGWNGATFGAGVFNSAVKADVFDMQWPPNEANELEELKFVSGDDSLTSFTKVNSPDPLDIVVGAGTYIKLKFGSFGTPGAGNASAYFYVQDAQTITYNQNGQQGGGLSHTSAVPLPAAAWLMFVGLGGLGLASRRKAKAA